MELETVTEILGEKPALALGGLIVGLLFGALAQRSRFCLRAATIEFGRGEMGSKVAIWVLAFSAAVAATQGVISLELLDVSEARQLSAAGSISGALMGGALFGVGMILARGCASRLLVLSATGNLRALVAGLILTVVAQASLRGVLSPSREYFSSLWIVEGGESRDILALLGLNVSLAATIAVIWLLIGIWFAKRNRISAPVTLSAIGVGLTVMLGWFITYSLSQASFEPVGVKSISFTGPSADTLMGLINEPGIPVGFDIGLVPGVFLGSFLASLIAREFKIQSFDASTGMLRYIIGAGLMGFGGMLAGGCAVGAGVTGSAVFSLTAWIALAAMWAGAMITDYLIDRKVITGKSATAFSKNQ
ncbi:MAG: YeeE/YedE family protein [Sneathiellales bacterium]|nr:YeeE/YedE family protein [Sneathiellales bacterium]